MGTWGSEPFDNDMAADWGNDLHDAAPGQRLALIRQALMLRDGYLDADDGQVAVAAAAVVAAVVTGSVPDSAYWPDFLTYEQLPDLPAELTDLAVAALVRVTGPDSELRALWADAGEDNAWAQGIAAVRSSLAP